MVAVADEGAGTGKPVTAVPTAQHAKPRSEGMRPGPGGLMGGGFDSGEGMIVRLLENEKLAKDAGVTDEQVATLKTKLDGVRKEQIDLRAELEKAALEQARLLSDKTVDEAAIMTAVDKTSEVHAKMARNRMKQLLIVKQTLTPEQTEKIKELMRERIGRIKEGVGRGDRERPPRRWDKPGEGAPPAP
jgi:Spy/CpxP family protein refolding chaperone